MFPSLQFLEKIPQHIFSIPNRRKESKRREHYCCYLLCQKAGLRVSEAINFDLSTKGQNGLYRLNKPKGQQKRFVYIPQEVIKELKANNWQPKQTNRFNFYHFLKKIKQEANLPANIELTPHTLRRAFATYHAKNGLPLPLLSKLLGHRSVRTTALYWMNIYHPDDNDIANILTGKSWLEKPKQPQPEPTTPIKVNLDKIPEPLTPDLPLFSLPPAKHLSKISQLEEKLSQIQQENNNLKSENNDLQQDLNNLSEQNALLRREKTQETTEKEQIQQDLTIAKETIKHLEQKLTAEKEKHVAAQNNLSQEKKVSNDLRQQLQTEREINTNLTQKIQISEQNYSNLVNTYQIALKDKEKSQKQANYYEAQLKSIAQAFHQWQKLNYYQQLEKEQGEIKAQILQREPPPWRNK